VEGIGAGIAQPEQQLNYRGLEIRQIFFATKNELKKINHKGHKEHIGREARKI
jgi:hypothetical protein